MPTDDELLERVQVRAGALRRRQRLLVAGGALAVVAVLLGGTVVAGLGGGRPAPVQTHLVDQPDQPDGPDATADPTDDQGADPCAPVPTARDLGSGGADPGGSPTVPTDGRGSVTSSTSSTPTDPRPARGDPAGMPPAESSLPPDDPPAVSASNVEASSESCPLQVRVNAGYTSGSAEVVLAVTVTALAGYDAHGFVVWDRAEPTQVDLGVVERRPGSCDVGTDDSTDDSTDGGAGAGAPVVGDFTVGHAYPGRGDKEVTVTFWAQRCDGPVHEVSVSVTVPL